MWYSIIFLHIRLVRVLAAHLLFREGTEPSFCMLETMPKQETEFKKIIWSVLGEISRIHWLDTKVDQMSHTVCCVLLASSQERSLYSFFRVSRYFNELWTVNVVITIPDRGTMALRATTEIASARLSRLRLDSCFLFLDCETRQFTAQFHDVEVLFSAGNSLNVP